MANKRLSEITSASPLSGTEFVFIEQSGNSRRTTASAIAALGQFVSEAPQDGRSYVRRNGAWRHPVAALTIAVTDPQGDPLDPITGAAFYRIPSTLDGYRVSAVAAALTNPSTVGEVSVQIYNAGSGSFVLSTALTVDAGEQDSASAAVPAVIDTTHDDVATGNLLRIDITSAGTGAKGLIVELQFQKDA